MHTGGTPRNIRRRSVAWPAAVEAELGPEFFTRGWNAVAGCPAEHRGHGIWPEDPRATTDEPVHTRDQPFGARHAAPAGRRKDMRVAGQPGRRHNRNRRPGKWRLWLLVMAVAVAAVSAQVASREQGRMQAISAGGPMRTAGRGSAAATAAGIRVLAARWVTGQVSGSAIVSCDPAMCAALAARGLPGANMLMLRPAVQGAAADAR